MFVYTYIQCHVYLWDILYTCGDILYTGGDIINTGGDIVNTGGNIIIGAKPHTSE